VAMDGEFPNLERLSMDTSLPGVTLPRTFGAPNLSHIKVVRVALPIQHPLLTTTGLVSLRLEYIPSYGYFPPSYLLASLSLIPQLETLWIRFYYHHDARDTSTTSHVTLPNLREFRFWGVEAYLEGLCAPMTATVLSVFCVEFPNRLAFAVPRLVSFIQTSENLQFHAVRLFCGRDCVSLLVQGDPQLRTQKYPLDSRISFRHLDSQISSAIQVLDAFSSILSVAEKVTLIVKGDEYSQWYHEVNRTQWRGLLRSFSNVKKLHVETKLVRGQGLAHSLCTEDGDLPLELLPNLEEVSYSGSDNENAFMPFINEREAVGRPVHLTLQHNIPYSKCPVGVVLHSLTKNHRLPRPSEFWKDWGREL
jgi:hypothetical protein